MASGSSVLTHAAHLQAPRVAARNTAFRRFAQPAALLAAAVAILLSHDPSLVTQPHFYAEDGKVFFADAYAKPPLTALVTPVAGYLLLFQRLVALCFTPLGLTRAAVTFALVSLTVQALPAVFFVSSRFGHVVPDTRLRLLIASVYLLLPDPEITGHLTNTQWHLAVLAFLVLTAAPRRCFSWRVFDSVVLVLCGLTGPYGVILLPLAYLIWRSRLDTWRRCLLTLLALTDAVQLGFIVSGLVAGLRPHPPLGVSLTNLVFIIDNQVLRRLLASYIPLSDVVLGCALAAGIVLLLAAAVRRGPPALRHLIAFAVMIMVFGLAFPYGAVPRGTTVWGVSAYGGWGTRYFFLMPLLLVLSALTLLSRRGPRMQRQWTWPATIGIAVVFCASLQWVYGAPQLQHLDRYQAQLLHDPPGTVVTIPIDPNPWTMTLVSR